MTRPYRILCIGAGDMFQHCVRTLLEDEANHVIAMITWSEKMSPKWARSTPSDDFAAELEIPLIKVETINSNESSETMRRMNPDLIFVDGWNEKIEPSLLHLFQDKFVGIHPSLLPKSRGGATLNWALIRRESAWGVTLFYLAEKIDQGDIIAQEPFILEDRDDIGSAFHKAALAAKCVLAKTIPRLREGKIMRTPQDHLNATYHPRRTPEQGAINWNEKGRDLYNLIRALTHPYPGSFFYRHGKKVFVWKASIEKITPDWYGPTAPSEAGRVVRIVQGQGVVVKCSDQALLLERMQTEKEPEMWGDDWCRKQGVQERERFLALKKQM